MVGLYSNVQLTWEHISIHWYACNMGSLVHPMITTVKAVPQAKMRRPYMLASMPPGVHKLLLIAASDAFSFLPFLCGGRCRAKVTVVPSCAGEGSTDDLVTRVRTDGSKDSFLHSQTPWPRLVL